MHATAYVDWRNLLVWSHISRARIGAEWKPVKKRGGGLAANATLVIVLLDATARRFACENHVDMSTLR